MNLPKPSSYLNMSLPRLQRHDADQWLHLGDLILHLTRRNFLLRYKGSALGILWSLLVPLSQLLVLVFVFGKVVPLNIEAYPAFVFSAILPWNWFSNCLGAAGSLFIGNRDLVRKPDFEPATLVIVDVLVNFLLYLVFLPILLAILIAYGRPITCSILALPLIMVIQALLTISLALIVATLNVFYRDIQYIVTVSLMLLFYLTPVFYAADHLAGIYRLVLGINPVGVLIHHYRAVLFFGQMPQWHTLFGVGTFSIFLCWIAFRLYHRCLPEMIDIL
ncbi:ABC transporter permease [Desulfatirhabdium butyrativorans]|uniref:ABC transporter permease n=1 Tax=Desulfatirhabdium butyrativorans TaxID=340467 RepID=UPI0003F88342|nr:ABC transporter permease [Desulfatirhabdium butyrativorans]